MWRIYRRHTLVRSAIAAFTRHDVVEVGKSHTQQRVLREHGKTLLKLCGTSEDIPSVAPLFEHLRFVGAARKNQANKCQHEYNAPGTPAGPSLPKDIDDEHKEQRKPDRAEHGHQGIA